MGASDVMDVGPEPEPSIIDRFQGEFAWLSNFHRVDVVLEAVVYPTVEHAYQAAKTRNKAERERMRACFTASGAKQLGKSVTLRKDWEDVKVELMYSLLFQKFSTPRLKELLLATGDREIVEGNWWGDVFWGVDLKTGVGENWLGVLIMRVREELNA